MDHAGNVPREGTGEEQRTPGIFFPLLLLSPLIDCQELILVVPPGSGRSVYCSASGLFDVSSSSSSSSIVPTNSIINASSIVNASENLPPTSSHPRKKRNRRIMYPEPIPLRGTTTANNTEQFEKPSESSNFHNPKPVSSVVVSILADPREAGDGETDGRISPNSLSRIFVVVLLDSVKYVTYSCVLPFKTSAAHLVN
ncbi:hypothetical protein BHE74_00049487 [Ensete ventricosum]|nr:hypothetical protein BHE74_00049487 [Ensete ventricosum]